MTFGTTQEAVDVLAAIPDQLEALARASSGATHATQSSEQTEAWTPSEIAGHLCDSARYWGARMFRVVHEDRPALASFDEQTMVALAAYGYRPLAELLAAFRLLSMGNVALLRSLDTTAWDRLGLHDTRGPITLKDIVCIEADHEQNHVRQFAEALGAPA